MVDLRSQYDHIKQEIDASIQDVLDTTSFVKGGKVSDFQHDLEAYLQVKHVIPVGNGTDALQIALMALGLQPGDEIITPTFTFIATVEVIALLGLKPVFVDVAYESFNLSTQAIENAITPRTRAIIPVHLFGQNADMEAILDIAKKHSLYVIEDACQSIGSTYTFTDGRTVQSGCMGDIGCTSFFPSKNLGCFGDGGAIFTNNDDLAASMRAIANHGMTVRYYHDVVGVNSRLDSIQAAVLQVKLNYLDQYIKNRQQAAGFYDNAFAGCKSIDIPARSAMSSHVYHQYTLKLAENINRSGMQSYLQGQGIPSMIYYPVPLHLQKAYLDPHTTPDHFPVSEMLCECVLSLPMHTELSVEQLSYITGHILEFVNK